MAAQIMTVRIVISQLPEITTNYNFCHGKHQSEPEAVRDVASRVGAVRRVLSRRTAWDDLEDTCFSWL